MVDENYSYEDAKKKAQEANIKAEAAKLYKKYGLSEKQKETLKKRLRRKDNFKAPSKEFKSPGELLKQREKEKKEVQEFKAKTGEDINSRIARGFQGYVKGRRRMISYSRGLRKSPYGIVPLRSRRVNAPAISSPTSRFQQMKPRFIAPGWESNGTWQQVEREVNSLNNIGIPNVAGDIEREVNFAANAANSRYGRNPSQDVINEVNFWSKSLDFNPTTQNRKATKTHSKNVTDEVSFWGNILP